ncbi:MAG: 6-bladed beta-propeller [Prolixibacteraceae bacterium]
MKVNFRFFVTMLVLLVFCKREDKSTPELDLQNLDKASQISITALGAVDIKYIPLSTDSNTRMSEIWNLKTLNNYFYIEDRGKKSKILKFSGTGDFLCEIGQRGKGPHEYLFSSDFAISSKNQNVFILSGSEDKFYIYSSEGKFIRTMSSPSEKTSSLDCLENNIICYSGNRDGSVKNSFDIIDFKGRVIKSFSNKYPYQSTGFETGFSKECIFYMYEGQLCIKEFHSDTIFIFDQQLHFTPKFILKQGIKRFLPEIREVKDMSAYLAESSKYISQKNLFESNSYLFFEFNLEKQHYYSISSKISGRTYLVNAKSGLINDLDGGPNILPKAIKDDNTIVAWIEAYQFKAYVASDEFKNSIPKYPEKTRELENLADALNENDNPILMLVKLKE